MWLLVSSIAQTFSVIFMVICCVSENTSINADLFYLCNLYVERKVSHFTWLLCLKNYMEMKEIMYCRGEAINCGCELY